MKKIKLPLIFSAKKSNSYTINVEPKPIIIKTAVGEISTEIVKIKVVLADLILNTSANAYVDLYNNLGKIKSVVIKLDGEKYENWGTGDEYIEEIILDELNLTKSN